MYTLDIRQVRAAMAANIAGDDMQIVKQVLDKRGVSSGTKSVCMQKMGLRSGSSPIKIMYPPARRIQVVFRWLHGFRSTHNIGRMNGFGAQQS
jgi:hypothetical protein